MVPSGGEVLGGLMDPGCSICSDHYCLPVKKCGFSPSLFSILLSYIEWVHRACFSFSTGNNSNFSREGGEALCGFVDLNDDRQS